MSSHALKNSATKRIAYLGLAIAMLLFMQLSVSLHTHEGDIGGSYVTGNYSSTHSSDNELASTQATHSDAVHPEHGHEAPDASQSADANVNELPSGESADQHFCDFCIQAHTGILALPSIEASADFALLSLSFTLPSSTHTPTRTHFERRARAPPQHG